MWLELFLLEQILLNITTKVSLFKYLRKPPLPSYLSIPMAPMEGPPLSHSVQWPGRRPLPTALSTVGLLHSSGPGSIIEPTRREDNLGGRKCFLGN